MAEPGKAADRLGVPPEQVYVAVRSLLAGHGRLVRREDAPRWTGNLFSRADTAAAWLIDEWAMLPTLRTGMPKTLMVRRSQRQPGRPASWQEAFEHGWMAVPPPPPRPTRPRLSDHRSWMLPLPESLAMEDVARMEQPPLWLACGGYDSEATIIAAARLHRVTSRPPTWLAPESWQHVLQTSDEFLFGVYRSFSPTSRDHVTHLVGLLRRGRAPQMLGLRTYRVA